MATATWNGSVLASSDDTVVVEGNHYFPREAVTATLVESPHSTVCGWKGTASYYSVEVDGEVNENAAWYYTDPEPEAAQVRDRIAFWHGVEVTD